MGLYLYTRESARHDEMLSQRDAAGSQGCEIYLHLIASPHHYLQLRCGAQEKTQNASYHLAKKSDTLQRFYVCWQANL